MATNYWLGGTSSAFATGANWFTGSAPTTGDTVIIDQTATGPLAASNQSAILLAALNVTAGNTQLIGDAATPLQIGATVLRIGDPTISGVQGNGSGRINLDVGAGLSNITIVTSSQNPVDTGLTPVRVKGTNASNVVVMLGGLASVAGNTISETATVLSCDVLGGTLILNNGVTWTTLSQSGGSVTTNSGGTTLNQYGGTCTTQGIGIITTCNIAGSTSLSHRPASGAMITTLNAHAGGVADFSGNPLAGTVTNTNVYRTSTVRLNAALPGNIVFTNPMVLAGGASTYQVS